MKQKIIYLLFLSIGVLVSLVSCGKKSSEYLNKTKFIYVNETNHTIDLGIGIIAPNSSLEIYREGDGPRDVTELSFIPPFMGDTTIHLDTTKCLTYKSTAAGVGEGTVGITNYRSNKIADRHYEFTYTFTKEEAQKATACP